jgi:2-oxoglutarate ferredoxin oxidoreductase subunit alpha
MEAFDLADKYRTPVMILGDGILGQMMEPVEFKKRKTQLLQKKDWTLTGAKGRPRRIIKTLYLQPEILEKRNLTLQRKYREITENEVRVETYLIEDAEIIIVAYGTVARIAKTAIKILREKGIRVGMVRPITLFPFPHPTFAQISDKIGKMLVVEMNMGQMLEDVKLGVCGKATVYFHGRTGGMVPSYDEIVTEVEKIVKEA